MKLLLTSQGLPSKLKETFVSLLHKPTSEIKLSFITTAAYGDYKNPKWLNVYRKQLNNYGIQQIEDLDLKDKNQKELETILKDKDIIFVNGGNSFYLLYWVRKSGFDKLLPQFLNQGTLYIGVSAGSYICCPTIEQSTWKHADRNKIGLKDLTALNFVPFLITAHFEQKHRIIIEKAARTINYPIVALNNAQAILVTDQKYTLVGVGNRVFFNGFKES
jgi:dipeptidase E